MLKHLKPLNLKSKSTHPHLQYRQESLFLLNENRLKNRNHFKLYSIDCLFLLFQVSDKRTLKNGDSDGEIDGSSEDDDEQKTKIGKF